MNIKERKRHLTNQYQYQSQFHNSTWFNIEFKVEFNFKLELLHTEWKLGNADVSVPACMAGLQCIHPEGGQIAGNHKIFFPVYNKNDFVIDE
jgi:hypothetical protein